MLFDSTAIIFSLIASVITKWTANSNYSYGYGRVETLTGFVNALALVFASGSIMWEALERLVFEQQELKPDNLLLVSVLGLLVNIVGIFAFDHGGAAHGHAGHSHGRHSLPYPLYLLTGSLLVHKPNLGHDSDSSHSHSHDHSGHHENHQSCSSSSQNPLMQGMFLHILSDALGSVGVIVSSLLIQYYGMVWIF